MRTKLFAAALIASTAIAAPAFAQDSDSTFTGPRAEGIVGWDHVKDDSIYGASKDSVVYGGAIGYDYQIGRAVVGVEGEITGASTKDNATGVLVAGDSLRVKADRDLYVGGRLGFVAAPRTLIYAKAGYTNTGFDTHYTAGGTTPIDIHDKDHVDGWRVGAGAEYQINKRVYLKGEYRYSDYSSDDNGIDAKRHQVVGGVGVRF
ncbi:porin family protein [Sphingomonas sp. JC676]|uniref:outer membrane protein n=1 Tax=Sphingomonas sp. JC676 TaxID=2768065 RepID=UPI0016580867|nr:porin family protein [Sphingomonas sp. JC676]MBC9032875.1 porin family protein [Sphingomonas sp. JC676]